MNLATVSGKTAFGEFLATLGFSKPILRCIVSDPKRLASSYFLNKLITYDETSQAAIVNIFGKLTIETDPTAMAERV